MNNTHTKKAVPALDNNGYLIGYSVICINIECDCDMDYFHTQQEAKDFADKANGVPPTLTVADIVKCFTDSRYGGYGYSAGGSWNAKIADEVLLEYAAKYNWTYENLFYFVNSRHGRHYMDACIPEATKFAVLDNCRLWNLIPNNDAHQSVMAGA